MGEQVAVDLVAEARAAYDKLSKSRVKNHAIVLKPDVDAGTITLEAEYAQGCELDDVAAKLPKGEPRFIVIVLEWVHADGIRKSNPIIMLAYCPKGLPMKNNFFFSSARTKLTQTFKQVRHTIDFAKALDIGDELLHEKVQELAGGR